MIDTHCHMDSSRYDDDREAAFQRAFDAGLTHLVLIGMVPNSIDATLALAER